MDNQVQSKMKKQPILIVDDDSDLLELLKFRLADKYDLAVADNAEEGLVQFSLHRPVVVVTDLRMDGMDGMALFEELHKANSSVPIIMMTAHGTIENAVEATKQGIFSFVDKTVSGGTLGKTLEEHIEKAIAISPGHVETEETDSQAWRADIITCSDAMEEILSQAYMLAQGDTSVFIRGPSGTGKELLAQAIHKASPRASAPFIAVNCAAIPEHLLESELFGHTKGSFTGAASNYEGLFKAADKGTIFLDEIGDMPASLQVKLLRVLQERQVRPVGSVRSTPIDVRVISATHSDIDKEMEKGNFREDLYYRLNVATLEIPSLNERRQDIPLLANHFIRLLSESNPQKKVGSFSPEAMELLMIADWQGNVRQLQNVVEQCFVLSTTKVIPARLVMKALRTRNGDTEVLSLTEAKKSFERDYLLKLLHLTDGNVTQAARLANRNRTEFYKLLHRHHLEPAKFKALKQQKFARLTE